MQLILFLYFGSGAAAVVLERKRPIQLMWVLFSLMWGPLALWSVLRERNSN